MKLIIVACLFISLLCLPTLIHVPIEAIGDTPTIRVAIIRQR